MRKALGKTKEAWDDFQEVIKMEPQNKEAKAELEKLGQVCYDITVLSTDTHTI